MYIWDIAGISVIVIGCLIYAFFLEVLRRALKSGIDMRLK